MGEIIADRANFGGSREIIVLPSMCDSSSQISVPAIFDIFQDTASLHADTFDMGPAGMERRSMFWILTKTRVHIIRRPVMLDRVTVKTWIQPSERVSCERDFAIYSGDELLIYGRSMWASVSRETGKLVRMGEFYPDVDNPQPVPDDRPFVRMGKHNDGAVEIGSYTIRSTDIDLGRHMNNVSYVRAMLGCYSSQQLEEMDINEVEVNYISQSFEGGTLRFLSRPSADDDPDLIREIAAVND